MIDFESVVKPCQGLGLTSCLDAEGSDRKLVGSWDQRSAQASNTRQILRCTMTSEAVNSWSRAVLGGIRAPVLAPWPGDPSLTWYSQTAASLWHHYSANKQSSSLQLCLQPDQESARSSTPPCRLLRAPNTSWTETKQRWPPCFCTLTDSEQNAVRVRCRATSVVRSGSSTSSSHELSKQRLFMSIIIPNMQLVGAPAALIKRLTADGSTSSIIELKCKKKLYLNKRPGPASQPFHFNISSHRFNLLLPPPRTAQESKMLPRVTWTLRLLTQTGGSDDLFGPKGTHLLHVAVGATLNLLNWIMSCVKIQSLLQTILLNNIFVYCFFSFFLIWTSVGFTFCSFFLLLCL